METHIMQGQKRISRLVFFPFPRCFAPRMTKGGAAEARQSLTMPAASNAFLCGFLPLPRLALPLLSAGNPHVKGSGNAHAPATPTLGGNCFPCHQAGETFGFPFKRCFLHFSSFSTRCKLLHCFTHASVFLNSVLCHPNKERHARK